MNGASGILNRLLSSEIKAEILVLFHKNPGIIDTIDGVSRRIGRTGNSIETDVKDMLDLGILKAKKIGRSEVIFLDHARDEEVQDIVGSYLRSLKR